MDLRERIAETTPRTQRRLQAFAIFAALVLAGGAVLLVNVVFDDAPTTEDRPSGGSVYQDNEAGFRLTYPPDWRVRSGAGLVEIFPAAAIEGDEPVATYDGCAECGGIHFVGAECEQGCKETRVQHPQTVYIAVQTDRPAEPCPALPTGCLHRFGDPEQVAADDRYFQEEAGASVRTKDVTLGGADALQVVSQFPARPPATGKSSGPNEWCSSCGVLRYDTHWGDGWRLFLTLYFTAETPVELRDAGVDIIQSLERSA